MVKYFIFNALWLSCLYPAVLMLQSALTLKLGKPVKGPLEK